MAVKRAMLTENDVVDSVAAHLQEGGWCIESKSYTGESGHDILATKDGVTLVVEAKGATSSKPETARYGQEFNNNQKHDHVAMALYRAAAVISAGRYRSGIAVPSDHRHRKLIDDIAPALAALRVAVFLVNDDYTVETHASSLSRAITGGRDDGS